MSAAPSAYVWWLAGRAAGVVAMGLVTASVLMGLAMACKLVPPRRRRDVVRLHEHVALLSLISIAAHGILLAFDPWLKAGVTGVTVPFALSYRPLWTGLGIVGGYLAAILGLSFYVRRRIGARLWRRLHRATVIVYGLSLAHALGSGTDASIPAVRYALLGSAVPVAALLALRVGHGRFRSRVRGADGTARHPAFARAALGSAASAARTPSPALQARGSEAT